MKGKIFLAIAICLAFVACEDDKEDSINIDIQGFTHRDNTCYLTSVDTNDWKPLPGLTDIEFCPNPVYYLDTAHVSFSLLEAAHVSVWAANAKGKTVRVIFQGDLVAGNHTYSVTGLAAGLYRIFIQIGETNTYGDIEVYKAVM